MPRETDPSKQPLTAKQMAFARAVAVDGLAPSAAYRQAYDADKSSPLAISVAASRLLRLPKITLTVERMRAEVFEPARVTAEMIVREAWSIASDSEQPTSARVAALGLLAKRHPEFSDKHDINERRVTIDLSHLSVDELRGLLE